MNLIQQAMEGLNDSQKDATLTTTFDEGEGKKDIICMNGPLGEAYTRALNVLFAKKDLTELGETQKEGEAQKAVVATETMIMDDEAVQKTLSLHQDLIDEANDALHPGSDIDKRFDFAAVDVPESSNTSAFVMTARNALKPEVVDQVQTASKVPNRQVVLVVVADPKGEAQGMVMRQRLVQLEDTGPRVSLDDDTDQFSLAAESLYSAHGVSVVHGMRGFIGYLHSRCK